DVEENADGAYDRAVSGVKDCLSGNWKTTEKVDGVHTRTTTMAPDVGPSLRVVSRDLSGDAYLVELWVDAPAAGRQGGSGTTGSGSGRGRSWRRAGSSGTSSSWRATSRRPQRRRLPPHDRPSPALARPCGDGDRDSGQGAALSSGEARMEPLPPAVLRHLGRGTVDGARGANPFRDHLASVRADRGPPLGARGGTLAPGASEPSTGTRAGARGRGGNRALFLGADRGADHGDRGGISLSLRTSGRCREVARHPRRQPDSKPPGGRTMKTWRATMTVALGMLGLAALVAAKEPGK